MMRKAALKAKEKVAKAKVSSPLLRKRQFKSQTN